MTSPWPTVTLVAYLQLAGVALVLAAGILVFWRVYRAHYLGWWAGALALQSVSGVATALAYAAVTGQVSIAWRQPVSMAATMTALLAPLLLLAGTLRVAGAPRVPRWLIAAGALLAVGVAVASWALPPPGEAGAWLRRALSLGARSAAGSAYLIAAAVVLVRGQGRTGYAARLLAGVFLVQATFDGYLAWRALASTTIPGGVTTVQFVLPASVLVATLTGIGMVVMLVEHERRQRSLLATTLERREARFRTLIERSSDVIVELDDRGTLLFVSPSCLPLTGYRPDELERRPLADLVHPDDRAALQATLAERALPDRVRQVVFRLRQRDGRWIVFEALARLLPDEPPGPRLVAALRDLTERRRLEDQLQQAQKMESLGQLAGGIAHDFNNLLTAIVGYTDLALQRGDLPPDLRADLEAVRQASDSATALTRHLLAFSRRQVVQPRVIDLNALVEDTRGLLRRVIGERIELRTDLATDLGCIRADPGQMQQVVMNLALNARDAMPEGGTLRIETRRVPVGTREALAPVDLSPGDYVRLSVADTGTGIEPAVLPHIFEPFFTTKSQTGGTGLGLATTYGIVRQAGGQVSVDSQVGSGTRFLLWFPLLAEARAEAASAPPQASSGHGHERLLVVEDEGRVRQFACDALADHGYAVTSADSAETALTVLDRRLDQVDLVVTDIVMPGLGGRELAARLRAARPDLPVLYITGYAGDDSLAGGAFDDRTAVLPKPFTARELCLAVRRLLGPTDGRVRPPRPADLGPTPPAPRH